MAADVPSPDTALAGDPMLPEVRHDEAANRALPLLGAGSDAVLDDLGYGAAEVAALRAAGVV